MELLILIIALISGFIMCKKPQYEKTAFTLAIIGWVLAGIEFLGDVTPSILPNISL